MWISISKKFKPADWWLKLTPEQQQAYVDSRKNTKYRDLITDIKKDLGDVPKMANTKSGKKNSNPVDEDEQKDVEDDDTEVNDESSIEEETVSDTEENSVEEPEEVENVGHPGLDDNGDPNEHEIPLEDGHNHLFDRSRIPPASQPEPLPPHRANELVPRRNNPPAPVPPNGLDDADENAIEGEYSRVPNHKIIDGIKKSFGSIFDSYRSAMSDTASYIRGELPDLRSNQEIQDDGTMSDYEKTQKLNDRKKIVTALSMVLVSAAAAAFLGPGAATFAIVMGLEYAEGYSEWLDDQHKNNDDDRPSNDPRVSGESTVNGTRYLNIVVNGRLQRRPARDYEEYIDSDGFKKVRRIDGNRESLSADSADQDLNIIINSFKQYLSTLDLKQNMIDFRNTYDNKR